MDYPELRLEILEIFVEAQREATNRRIGYENRAWGYEFRSGRFRFAENKTELGRAPALATCIRCGLGLTSSDPKVVRGHVERCGVKPARAPQLR